jgi:hypothetical protein
MRMGRFVYGLVIGISMSICLAGALPNPATAQDAYSIFHNFAGGATDGLQPYGSLTLSESILYGMTHDGPAAPGYHYSGILFRINTDGTGYQVLLAFANVPSNVGGPYGPLALSGSKHYGMAHGGGPKTGGVVFEIDTDGRDKG